MHDRLLRRVGVYARCIVEGDILLTRLSHRDPDRGRWTLPGGGMEFGESPHETLIREFHEETGLEPVVGSLLVARSQVFPPRVDRGPLQAIQIVYEATASGRPTVLEEDGTTDEVAWVPLDTARSLALVELARWALRP